MGFPFLFDRFNGQGKGSEGIVVMPVHKHAKTMYLGGNQLWDPPDHSLWVLGSVNDGISAVGIILPTTGVQIRVGRIQSACGQRTHWGESKFAKARLLSDRFRPEDTET